MRRYRFQIKEIFLYHQVCKDFRWPNAENVIEWARGVRAVIVRFTTLSAATTPGVHGLEPQFRARAPTHVCVRRSSEHHSKFKGRFRYATEQGAIEYVRIRYGSDFSGTASKTQASIRSTRVMIHQLPVAFPLLPSRFTTAPLPTRSSIVVLDMFGDREGAIRHALQQWLAFTKPSLNSCEATKTYIELKALTIREKLTTIKQNYTSYNATSIPSCARATLSKLTDVLLIPQPLRPLFLNETLSVLLHPPVFDDGEPACEELVRHGSTIVALVPYSLDTLTAP
ncbi:hypothetical protein C8Q77DRAFT_199743 [Trametes polyzona]|nr:hypothetical protein C8Q77DRAFT_199743 [Trametes polyzona]